MAYIGVSPSNGVRRKHTYTATANQTSFSGAGAEGITLGYLDSNYVDVYQNGVKLAEEDYTSTSRTAIVLAQGASADDIIEVVVYDVFSVADTVSKSAGGTFDGNVAMAGTLTANGGAVFNEASADVDFRVESDNLANALFVQGSDGAVGIGTNVPASKLDLYTATASGFNYPLFLSANNADAAKRNYVQLGFSVQQSATGSETGGFDLKALRNNSAVYLANYGGAAGAAKWQFYTEGTERMRIDSAGNIYSNVTVNPVSQGGTTETGQFFGANGYAAFGRVGGVVAYFNRQNNDGDIVAFRQDGSDEGTISISGTTTSYNAFSGSHWSRLTDNSKPIILKGTIIETIDEMCDWYQAKFTIPAITSKDEEGNEIQDTPEQTIKDSIALPSEKKVGDTISHTYEGVTYDNAVIIKEGDNKHPKCKISDTADSKRVYGVHAAWDNDDDTVNDMYVTAVGTHVVRINKDVTVSAGDLISSNGDGTAKVQDDDIIRSKTIGKVLTNIKQETYSDGSYTVPCALYCG